MRKVIGIILLVWVVIGGIPLAYSDDDAKVTEVSQTCFAEVKWTYWNYLRRGPSENYGIKRNIPSGVELRVLGRNEADTWVQVHLPSPSMVGWMQTENISLYGHCRDLPITVDNLEPETPTVAPDTLPLPSYAENLDFADTERIFYLNDGMLYVRHEEPELRAHMVIVDLNNPAVDVAVSLGAVANVHKGFVSEMVAEHGALVGINGDFYVQNYMPQGLTVIDHQIVSAPLKRATFAITDDGEVYMGYFTENWTWDGTVIAPNGEGIPLQRANIPCNDEWVCIHTDVWPGLPLSDGYAGLRILLSPEFEVVSITIDEPLLVPDGHYVLRTGSYTEAGKWLLERLEVGDTVEVNMTTTPAWQDYAYAISGGPMLVRDGEFWQECDFDLPEDERECEDFNNDFRNAHYGGARIARSGVGYNRSDHLLILIMVEGSEVYGSKGIAHEDFANLFIRLGAESAMEFDGGGSSILWVDRNPVNSFTDEGERPITNALLVFWNGD